MTNEARDVRALALRSWCSAPYRDLAERLLDEILSGGGAVRDDDALRRRLRTTRPALRRLQLSVSPMLVRDRGEWRLQSDAAAAPGGENPHESRPALFEPTRAGLAEEAIAHASAALVARGMSRRDADGVLDRLCREVGRDALVHVLRRWPPHVWGEADTGVVVARLVERLAKPSVQAGGAPSRPAKANTNVWKMDGEVPDDCPTLLVERPSTARTARYARIQQQIADKLKPRPSSGVGRDEAARPKPAAGGASLNQRVRPVFEG